MAVIRFDPFRDPIGAAVVHGRDGDVCPARHAHGRLPRRGWQLLRGDGSYNVEADLPASTLTASRSPSSTAPWRSGRTHPASRRQRAGHRRRAAPGVVHPPAVPRRGRGPGEPHRRLRRRCPASDHPRLAQDPGPPGRDHPCARRQPHPLGSTSEQGEGPPAAPASAEQPPDQAGAGHHGIRAGTGPGPAENYELAATRWRPGGPADTPDGHTRHSRSAARSLPEPAPAYRTAGAEAQCPAGGTPEVVPV